jgi:hypothetical protein
VGELLEISGVDGQLVELFGLGAPSKARPTCAGMREVAVVGEKEFGLPLMAPVIVPVKSRKDLASLREACIGGDAEQNMRCVLNQLKKQHGDKAALMVASEFASKVKDGSLSRATMGAIESTLGPEARKTADQYVGEVRTYLAEKAMSCTVAIVTCVAVGLGLGWLFLRKPKKARK